MTARKALPLCRKFCVLYRTHLHSTHFLDCIYSDSGEQFITGTGIEKREMNLVEIFGIPSNQQIITALLTSRKPQTYRELSFYRIKFSFIQIMDSFFRAARKREVFSCLSTADSEDYYRLC